MHPIPLAPLKRERGDESDWDCSKLYKRHSKISFVPAAPLLYNDNPKPTIHSRRRTASYYSAKNENPQQPPSQIQNPPFLEEGYAMQVKQNGAAKRRARKDGERRGRRQADSH